MLRVLAGSLIGGLLLATPVAAQSVGTAPQEAAVPSAQELANQMIHTLDGDEIGSVRDVIIDHNGEVLALVFETGGFLGVGESLRVVPVDRVRVNEQGVFLDLPEDMIADLPTQKEWTDRHDKL